MRLLNDIRADEPVATSIWVRLADGGMATTDGLSEKRFATEAEAEAFRIGVEFLAERSGFRVLVSDINYSTRFANHYVVRTAIGKALDNWEV